MLAGKEKVKNVEGSDEDCAKPPLTWQIIEQEYVKWVAENLDKDMDLTDLNETSREIAEPPDDLTIPLFRFKKEWLSWALKQEENVGGGILADEMGMGKTVEAIALVLTKRNEIPHVSEDPPAIKGTLVICPVAALKQWEREIKRCTLRGSAKVVTYHGARRRKELGQLSEYDFVITTYTIVEVEYSASLLPQEMPHDSGESVLHSVVWDRIILDEAHYIKTRSSKRTKAVLALKSSYKWALTGTPVHNRMGELYSLVRFLQIVPYSYYFCKDCDCRTLDYRSSKQCPDCAHTFFRHFSWWNKAMILLKRKILKNIMLRRTKKEREADLKLPPRIETLRWDSLNSVEEHYYKIIQEKSRKKLHRYAVNHPYLVEYAAFQTEMKAKTCTSCDQSHEDTMVTPCQHIVCKSCLIDVAEQKCCPSCSSPVPGDFTSNAHVTEGQTSRTTIEGFRPSSILNRIHLDNFQSSTKIDALREEIRSMVEMDSTAKGLVFSEFSSFLDLIQYALQKSGVKCARLDGSMSVAEREAAITRFTEDPDCIIFLMTLKAGGVALNLTVASHVFLMDPCWNPAVERQAHDRVHRIGQYKPVRIVRFIIKNTVEERLLELQKKKDLVFQGTIGEGSADALTKLTESELYCLFL
ncbi:Nucleotide excision repair protein RAD16 [Handroanthus impetiginosus]|uniref:Nucleotide excision repair protein RAD16 n=1 Tax=Handroanthus impetiginosus TaxID=429701 RepID=A0A2G9HUH5_9LAMI|nr:Nucleotide excision repair protein RAD16 [Handroanthus impetiginosus]